MTSLSKVTTAHKTRQYNLTTFWEQSSLALLRLQHFWLKRQTDHTPQAWLHRVLNSANCFRSSAISRTRVADEDTWKQAQETPGGTNVGMRFSLINSWNGPILLWKSGWNVWWGKTRWSWFFLNTLFPSGLWITVVWGSWVRTK